MAEYSRREVTTKHVEYFVPSPIVWGEVHKVLAAVRSELGDNAKWDDAAIVEGRNDEIVIRFKVNEVIS